MPLESGSVDAQHLRSAERSIDPAGSALLDTSGQTPGAGFGLSCFTIDWDLHTVTRYWLESPTDRIHADERPASRSNESLIATGAA